MLELANLDKGFGLGFVSLISQSRYDSLESSFTVFLFYSGNRATCSEMVLVFEGCGLGIMFYC
jgi:hypothetical protein